MYLNHQTARGKFSKVAQLLGVSASTVSRRYDKWIELQQVVAAAKAAPELQQPSSITGDEIAQPETHIDRDYVSASK